MSNIRGILIEIRRFRDIENGIECKKVKVR